MSCISARPRCLQDDVSFRAWEGIDSEPQPTLTSSVSPSWLLNVRATALRDFTIREATRKRPAEIGLLRGVKIQTIVGTENQSQII